MLILMLLKNIHFFKSELFLQKMKLIEGTPAYSEWKKPSDPSFLKIYLFHVANPHDIVTQNAKPYLQEQGPYVFR